MEKIVENELHKYWDDLPENLTDKEAEFLLKASKAIDEHKKNGTEPEDFLSSPETLLEMYHNVISKPQEVLEIAMINMNKESYEDMDKMQKMIEFPFFVSAQAFEYNISLYDCAAEKLSKEEFERLNTGDVKDSPKKENLIEERLTEDSITRFKASYHRDMLDKTLLPAYEILQIQKQNPGMDFEQAHDCFSKMQDMAINHFTLTTGLDIVPSEKSTEEENKNKGNILNIVLLHPRETLALTEGTTETKIFGLGDLRAKLSAVSKEAQTIDATNLSESINRLQENRQEGFSKKMGIGGEFKEVVVSKATRNTASR